MATILWCYLRNDVFKQDKDYHLAADLGAGKSLGVTIEADIIKQKLPEYNHGYAAAAKASGKIRETNDRIYTDLVTDHPDLTRYQVLNCYCGRLG